MSQPHIDARNACEAFRQDTMKSWADYQETGLHVTSAALNLWLASWGTENELPAPAGHP